MHKYIKEKYEKMHKNLYNQTKIDKMNIEKGKICENINRNYENS